MALSQVQCLDDNHVNPVSHESEPEFLYSEDQRLALEALVHGGRKAFQEYIKDHGMRQFLSDLEQNQLTGATVLQQPESEGEGAENSEDVAGSLQYWPERSEDSIPEFDRGWPDRVSYRGVTRVSVYMQPPVDGQPHIKEIVRKTIALAQKVIAVVMDMFTDVDIFKDLLDAGFRRRVAVYIILETTGVPHFLTMCKRAAMHRGHLKNLRVRCAGGTVLHTRSVMKVRGQLSQKFMFVDGARAVTGSYSYTWMASRLDRNLVTVLTGEAVETFDKQFRELYLLSKGVNLSEIDLEEEPQPKFGPRLTAPSTPSPAVDQKLTNPKYALVGSNASSAVQSSIGGSLVRSSTRTAGGLKPAVKILRQLREVAEGGPIHPALLDLERADLIHYLPTWPEPDPPSDITGDCSNLPQAHVTQVELRETSQPIHNNDPPVMSKEPLPENACLSPPLKNLRTTNNSGTQAVQNEAKEVSSISVPSEEHDKNFNSLSTTNDHRVQKEEKEVAVISATSEENYKKITTDETSTTDNQRVWKEGGVTSISAMPEEHNKKLRTPNGPSTKNVQGVQKESNVDSIAVKSGEHSESLSTAKDPCMADKQEEQNVAKDVSIISTISEEHDETLRTPSSPSTTDTQAVQKEVPNGPNTTDPQELENKEKEVSSISSMPEDHYENLRTGNSSNSTDTQAVQKEAKGVASEEHYENTGPAKHGSACNGSAQSEVQGQADEQNAARTSQPVVEQQLQEQSHPQHASGVFPKGSEQKQDMRHTHRQVQTDRWKAIPTSSRPPSSEFRYEQEVHALRHGRQLAQNRLGWGNDHHGSASSRPAQTWLENQVSHAPYRQLQVGPQGQWGWTRPAHQGTTGYRLPGPQGDGWASTGLSTTRYSQYRTVNGNVPEAQLGSLQRRAQQGRRGTY